jgi:outer membrane protein assembly factor BamA
MKQLLSFFLFAFCLNVNSLAQKSDTTQLPFAIANEKKLSNEDLSQKKEGAYVTGAPDISSDPVSGFGVGGEGSLFFNGKRKDPFFAYTAYRAKLDFVVFTTTKSQHEFFLRLDVPYIFNTKWRLRTEGGYEANPNLLYFGNTAAATTPGLSYYPNSDSTQAIVYDASYKDYEKNVFVGANKYYNNFFKKEWVLNVSMERSYLEGKLRALIGYEAAYVNMTSFEGNSLIQNDHDSGQTLGLQKGWVQIYQVGLIYDTRDLEPDPNHGIFAEVTNELSLKSLGSTYDFNKTFAHVNVYQKLFPGVFKRLIFAGRIAGGYTALNAPFFELQDQWSSEGSIEGIGGAHTLRGYKQFRFMDRVANFDNFELRWRFTEATIVRQHLEFSAVPFYDMAGVWANLTQLNFSNLRHSEGLGLRIAWNESSILRFDYAISKEDNQFFFNLAHTF